MHKAKSAFCKKKCACIEKFDLCRKVYNRKENMLIISSPQITDFVRGEFHDTKNKVMGRTPTKPASKVAMGAASLIGTAGIISCSLISENYEAKLKADQEKR